ncbi:MAG: hypothetical protein ACR2HP_02985 [Ilumatobacteraceae bacterium]
MLCAEAGALGAELDWLLVWPDEGPHVELPAAGVAEPPPQELVDPGSVDDEGPQLPVLLAPGAVPHPDGSVGELDVLEELGDPLDELAAAGSAAAELDHALADDDSDEVPDEAPDSRFRNAVMSLPVGTTATTSQPSPDFSVSLAVSVDASNDETLTESNSDMPWTITIALTWW